MTAAVEGKQLVAAPSKMTDEHFRLHMNNRHGHDIPSQGFTCDVSQPYRALHRRAHRLEEFEHEHPPEPEWAAIEQALDCLMQNQMWGWRQIAGAKGVTAAHPDGSWAIRFDKEVRYFNISAQAARCLLKGRFVK